MLSRPSAPSPTRSIAPGKHPEPPEEEHGRLRDGCWKQASSGGGVKMGKPSVLQKRRRTQALERIFSLQRGWQQSTRECRSSGLFQAKPPAAVAARALSRPDGRTEGLTSKKAKLSSHLQQAARCSLRVRRSKGLRGVRLHFNRAGLRACVMASAKQPLSPHLRCATISAQLFPGSTAMFSSLARAADNAPSMSRQRSRPAARCWVAPALVSRDAHPPAM